MKTPELLDRTLSVNETVARFPQTIAVFNRMGIDSCCGGALPLDDAARREGVDPDALFDALTAELEKA